MLEPLYFVRLDQNEARDDSATVRRDARPTFGNALVDDLGDGFLLLLGIDDERDFWCNLC